MKGIHRIHLLHSVMRKDGEEAKDKSKYVRKSERGE